jgi:hypothetical protein
MQGSSQPDYSDALQDFFKFIEEKRQPGVIGAATENGDATRGFLPYDDLKTYFAKDTRLREVLRAVFESPQGPPPVAFKTVRENLRVFSILLYIRKGSFIQYFVRHDGLSDSMLPFYSRPQDFPAGPDDFFPLFYECQWMFCAKPLKYNRYKNWKESMILPIISKERIGDGGSAVTYKIKVHPWYNHLREGVTRPVIPTSYPHYIYLSEFLTLG